MKSICTLYILSLLSLVNTTMYAQEPTRQIELNHLDSIRSLNLFNEDSVEWTEYLIENVLFHQRDSIHITNRRTLNRINRVGCFENFIQFYDTIYGDERLYIEIAIRSLDSMNVIEDEFGKLIVDVKNIDSTYGAHYIMEPPTIIESIHMSYGDRKITISDDLYNDLYNPFICSHYYREVIELYSYGDFIYIYIPGGKAANYYLAKIIVNLTNGTSRIVATYGDFSIFGGFYSGFIGF